MLLGSFYIQQQAYPTEVHRDPSVLLLVGWIGYWVAIITLLAFVLTCWQQLRRSPDSSRRLARRVLLVGLVILLTPTAIGWPSIQRALRPLASNPISTRLRTLNEYAWVDDYLLILDDSSPSTLKVAGDYPDVSWRTDLPHPLLYVQPDRPLAHVFLLIENLDFLDPSEEHPFRCLILRSEGGPDPFLEFIGIWPYHETYEQIPFVITPNPPADCLDLTLEEERLSIQREGVPYSTEGLGELALELEGKPIGLRASLSLPYKHLAETMDALRLGNEWPEFYLVIP